MVNCSYCDKEIKRNVFCTDSHKVMFNRKLDKPAKEEVFSSPLMAYPKKGGKK